MKMSAETIKTGKESGTAAGIATRDLSIENEQLKSQVESLSSRLGIVENALDEANTVIEADVRAKKVNRLKAAGVKLKDSQFAEMSLDELDNVERSIDLVEPAYRSIKAGVPEKPDTIGLTVGDLSFKNKAGK